MTFTILAGIQFHRLTIQRQLLLSMPPSQGLCSLVIPDSATAFLTPEVMQKCEEYAGPVLLRWTEPGRLKPTTFLYYAKREECHIWVTAKLKINGSNGRRHVITQGWDVLKDDWPTYSSEPEAWNETGLLMAPYIRTVLKTQVESKGVKYAMKDFLICLLENGNPGMIRTMRRKMWPNLRIDYDSAGPVLLTLDVEVSKPLKRPRKREPDPSDDDLQYDATENRPVVGEQQATSPTKRQRTRSPLPGIVNSISGNRLEVSTPLSRDTMSKEPPLSFPVYPSPTDRGGVPEESSLQTAQKSQIQQVDRWSQNLQRLKSDAANAQTRLEAANARCAEMQEKLENADARCEELQKRLNDANTRHLNLSEAQPPMKVDVRQLFA